MQIRKRGVTAFSSLVSYGFLLIDDPSSRCCCAVVHMRWSAAVGRKFCVPLPPIGFVRDCFGTIEVVGGEGQALRRGNNMTFCGHPTFIAWAIRAHGGALSLRKSVHVQAQGG